MKNKKLWKFKMIAILLPFLFMLLIEVVLRFCNYGYNTNIFTKDETGKYYYLNPDLSRKYFTIQENATQGNYELFAKEKPPGTLRFFILGESSSVGFPYMHNGAFSRILKYRLQFEYPNTNFEIINLSLTAVNSYTLYDISKQLVKYQPDAILIYSGHNEYYGALGVASSSSIGTNYNWVRATIALKEFRLAQLLFNLASKLKGTEKKATDYSLTLMQRMALSQSIPYNSSLFQQGIKQFDYNMTDMLKLFSKHKIPVYLSNLVYNQKDLKPFITCDENLSADKEFRFANIAYAKQDYIAAKKHYILAKEYDGLRFRAPEQINVLIKQYAKNDANIHFVDAVNEFELISPHGIMDSTLLLEHVHPNLQGQLLLSNAFYKELKKSNIFKKIKSNNLSYRDTDFPFTPFDSIFGQISIWLLKEQWPFNQTIPAENPNHIRSFEEQIAGACAVKQINWFDSMQSLYEYYKQQKKLYLALQIIEGLCLEFPNNEEYYTLAAKLSLIQNDQKKALFYLNKANYISPNNEVVTLRNMIVNHKLPADFK